jgi:hypothetical protein
MTESTTNKPPVWFWIVSVVALIWNLMGVMVYITSAFITDEMIAALPEEQQTEFLIEHPAWYTAAFALAVFCGALGCILLLLRKKWAYMLLMFSMIAVLVQHTYIFVNSYQMELVMPILIIVVSIFLVWFSKNSITKGWIK